MSSLWQLEISHDEDSYTQGMGRNYKSVLPKDQLLNMQTTGIPHLAFPVPSL
jgi:hypothetical protein